MSTTSLTTIYAIQRYIQSSLSLRENDPLNAISPDDAQTVLDEIWKVLDSVALPMAADDKHFFSYRNKLRKFSLKLSITYEILPSSLVLRGVQCLDNNPSGAGSFADVYIGIFQGVRVALKRLRIYLMAGASQAQHLKQLFYRESLLWKNLMNEHVVPFLGVAEDVFPGTVCMVIPWMENGALKRYIEKLRQDGQLMGEEYVARINNWLYQIADGLAYLHGEGLVHGDLHGGNILVDDAGNARLTDFGMALISESTSYGYGSLHGGGAIRWKAPELIDPDEFELTSSRPTRESDIFSFACICIELYSGKPPMPDLTENQVSRRYVKGLRPDRPELPDGGMMHDSMWSLTESCWAQFASQRPSAQHVVLQMAVVAGIEGAAARLAEEAASVSVHDQPNASMAPSRVPTPLPTPPIALAPASTDPFTVSRTVDPPTSLLTSALVYPTLNFTPPVRPVPRAAAPASAASFNHNSTEPWFDRSMYESQYARQNNVSPNPFLTRPPRTAIPQGQNSGSKKNLKPGKVPERVPSTWDVVELVEDRELLGVLQEEGGCYSPWSRTRSGYTCRDGGHTLSFAQVEESRVHRMSPPWPSQLPQTPPTPPNDPGVHRMSPPWPSQIPQTPQTPTNVPGKKGRSKGGDNLDEALVQEVIKKMGYCPWRRDDWVRERAGYRCRGGEHFVTHFQIREAIKEYNAPPAVTWQPSPFAEDVNTIHDQRLLAHLQTVGDCWSPWKKTRTGYACRDGVHTLDDADIRDSFFGTLPRWRG